ncbi:MAG: trypsin-like peptidase domain-containing protein [Acidimicrobiales bacterium]
MADTPRLTGTIAPVVAVLALFGMAVSLALTLPEDSQPVLTADEVVESARPSTVLISAIGCRFENSGSGVVLREGVVTNAHVVAGSDELMVVDASGTAHDARLAGIDPELDLALLEVDGLESAPLETGAPTGGTEVVAFVRSSESIEVQMASVERTINIRSGDIYGQGTYLRRGLELQADIDAGDSGGAVVDLAGNVVGIVFSSSRGKQDVAYAVSAIEVERFLARQNAAAVDSGECRRQ